MPKRKEALVDHVIVLDRLGPTLFRAHQEVESAPADPAQQRHVDALAGLLDMMPPDHPSRSALTEAVRAGREPKERYVAPLEATTADVHHLGEQRFVVAPYACACGDALAEDPGEVLGRWTYHAGAKCGVDQAVLAAHPVVALAGERATAVCGCGLQFQAAADDPTNPAAALAGWERHVRALG